MSSNKRIDFDRNTLDGTLLSQILLRLRNVEASVDLGGGGGIQRTFVAYDPSIPLESAVDGVTIVFTGLTTSVSSAAFQSAPNGSIFNYANVTESEVTISDGFAEVMTLVPGEFTSIIRFGGEWYGSLGII